jgi:drug/metabolite transporter (DMT)-like permease
MLFTYMTFFSFAYLSLSAGTGALILFGAVQLTMFIVALRGKEQFPLLSWAGLTLAILGLVYLVSPGVTAPDPLGAVLMAIAGIAWGFYSLLGKGVTDPLEATANNFIYSVPLVIIISLFFMGDFNYSLSGLALAMASGAIASGLGYSLWYAALRGLTATRAATVQLSVPVIAAFGGVILLSEPITLRLLLASAATLGGVAIVLAQRMSD